MNEHFLLKLIQLFSIASRFHLERRRVNRIVRQFLEDQLSIHNPENYLQQFDEFHTENLRAGSRTSNVLNEERFSVRESSRMVRLCSELNEELNLNQKINVIIVLVSLLESDGEINPTELEFLHSVAEVFNVSREDFHQVYHFSLQQRENAPDLRNVLVFTSDTELRLRNAKAVFVNELPGYLAILWLEKAGSYHIKSGGSRSSSLNGVPMLEDEVYDFRPGDLVKGGNASPVFYSDVITRFLEDQQDIRIHFEVSNLSYRFASGNTGLHPLDFYETSGKMVGLMGASGAGKSTLLEVLNGNLKPATGNIRINGLDLHSDKKKLEGLIGYVPQDDLLMEELTVFQNLFYAAKLSFADKAKEELKSLVLKTLQDLGLAHIAGLKVGSPMQKIISGGERKRVNIGLELLRAPGILFLDEPTSGLSSRDSQSIIELLKDLSLQGKLIFVVIHQPSSDIFKMFDRLLIMDKGGYPIYYGNPVQAIVYFKDQTNQLNKENPYCFECGHVNPETIFDLIEAKRVTEFGKYTLDRRVLPEEWYQLFRKNFHFDKSRSQTLPMQAIRAANWRRQFQVFIKRDLLSKINNRQYLAINLLQAPLLGIILAYINRYHLPAELYAFSENDNIPVFVFISIIVCLFLGLTVSAEEIFRDRKILKREKFLNLSRSSYLLSKVLILFCLSAFQTLTFWFVSAYILHISDFSWVQLGLLFSTSAFANMLGLNISSAFNQAVTIYILIPILLIPQLVLGGIVIPFHKINPSLKNSTGVPVISETMASRWAYEGMMVSFYCDNQYNKPIFPLLLKKNESSARQTALRNLDEKLYYASIYGHSGLFKHKEKIKTDLEVLQNEFRFENSRLSTLKFDRPERLVPGCPPSVIQEATAHLSALTQHYASINERYSKMENDLSKELEKKTGGKNAVVMLKMESHNNEVENIVLNNTSIQKEKKVFELNGRMMVTSNPVLRPPDGNRILSFAHFFSPYKYLLGVKLETPVFNIFMLWLMSGLLYFLLWMDGLRKFMELYSSGKRKK
jgi:ABC-type multidrug transport system ATPase subunit/uncharacterized tellurite resistance protein B-like protein